MRVAVTGSTGLVGSRLVRSLRADGHDVVRLVRPGTTGADGDTLTWDPERGTIDAAGLEGVDAAVHLAGENIGARRWSAAQKRRLLESRTKGTSLLASTLAGLDRKPAVLVSASGIDAYGSDRGDEVLTEDSSTGDGFLGELCAAWEGATQAAADAGIRTVVLRTGMVLAPEGGALGRMLPLFRFGLGGRMGSGRQWWSWVSIDDHVAATRWLLDHEELAGPVNLTAPQPVTNAEFTKALASALRRPAFLAVPAFGPRLVLGRELADALLFGSKRVVPARLEGAGFTFRHPDIATAFRAVLDR